MKLETIYETLRNHYGDLGWWQSDFIHGDDSGIGSPDKRIHPSEKESSSLEKDEANHFSQDEKEQWDTFHLQKDMIKLFHKHKRIKRNERE